MRLFVTLFCLVSSISLIAQKVTLNPTVTPTLFKYNDQITVTYDVTGTPLASLTTAWIWVWIPGKSVVSKYNVNPASNDPTKTDNAKFTKSIVDGKTLFTKTFIPTDAFEGDISAETKLGILLKGNDWGNGQTTDFVTDIWDGSFQIKLTSPTQQPLFVSNGNEISITGETPVASDYTLYINDVLTDTQNAKTNYTYTHLVTETSGYATVKLVATNGASTDEVSFQYIISGNSPAASRPAGIIPGINYNTSDHSKVTFCLWAPGKSSVYVRGDFSQWKVLPENLMKKDGEYFWIEISGLTEGVEYGFQYLVNETVFVADPYADKILDPDDQYIPTTVYPGLKAFPQEIKSEKWYFNRVAIVQTGQTPYAWQITNFEKPAKENLVVYELLIRDFFEAGDRSYKNLMDTLTYFKRLGVNAIELMPVMEFNGNESWGYNPAFMFAPDKSYGTKNDLKKFIDACHAQGIAVIFDIAMNHQDLPNPYVMMDFDFAAGKPTANNKWFNISATHPYSVFFDMNHESSYTKEYLDTINHYWLNEYKVDGFRYDLSKGFTQTYNPNNVGAWGNYDASRIAILKRMADQLWQHTPDGIIILEHFAANSEEKELAEYRSGEGKGMMLWGNLNRAYSQNSTGYSADSDISWVSHLTRGWTVPHVVGYMESHDEERMMYRNLQFGNALGNYNIKTPGTALDRVKSASAFFFTIPGPKMLWQFGELGYDVSIDFNGRVGNKPVKWEYADDPERVKVFKTFAELIKLKQAYSVFGSPDVSIQGGTSLLKQIIIKNQPYNSSPATTNEMNVVVVGNFDVITQSVNVNFPHNGKWFHYFSNGDTLEVSALPFSVSLLPGEFRLYTDVRLPVTEPELMAFVTPLKPELISVEESTSSIVLNWLDKSTIESGYKIYRKKTGGSYQLIKTTNSNVTSFEDENSLEPLTEYHYYVQAFNGYGFSNSAELTIVTTNLITAVETELSSSIRIFPVPTTRSLSVVSIENKILHVDILDTKGLRYPVEMENGSIDVSNLSAGLYIVEITTNKGIARKKFIRE